MNDIVTIKKSLAAPADLVWSAIAGIGGLERWFPAISTCQVIGSGVGALRLMTLTGGGNIEDRIEVIDHERRRLQYLRTQSPFPVSHYLGNVEVQPTAHGCELIWTLEIAINAADQRDELIGFLRQTITAGIEGLERDLL